VQKKLTITVDEKVYKGLHKVIGRRKISKFVEGLVRPHVVRPDLEAEYARMARQRQREAKAREWAEGLIGGAANEEG
jgi:predicted CopG family antitoxin